MQKTDREVEELRETAKRHHVTAGDEKKMSFLQVELHKELNVIMTERNQEWHYEIHICIVVCSSSFSHC